MDWLDNWNRAMEYLEEHLEEELDLNALPIIFSVCFLIWQACRSMSTFGGGA